jgi:hypothetical protein
MNAALSTLGLEADQLTAENLKIAFKAAALRSHPDKGGADFDEVLSAYLYLSQVVRRQTGGRDGLAILDPREVEAARQTQFERELNNMVVEVMEAMDRDDQGGRGGVDVAFHAAFERLHVSEQRGGYGQWLKGRGDAQPYREMETIDPMKRYERYQRDPYASYWLKGEAAPVEAMDAQVDHAAFEVSHPPAGTIVLHLSEMATYSRPVGTLLAAEESGFHSLGEMDYTDLHAAYETDAIIRDKVPAAHLDAVPTLEEIMAAREASIAAPQTNEEMEEMAAYEKRREAQEAEHQTRITDFFASAPASQWALPRVLPRDTSQASDSFIKTV